MLCIQYDKTSITVDRKVSISAETNQNDHTNSEKDTTVVAANHDWRSEKIVTLSTN